MTEVKDDQTDQPPKPMSARWGLLAMLFASPVILLFAYLGKIDEGWGAWICTGIVFIAVKLHWRFRRRNPWFWMAIVVALLLQIPVALFPLWSDRYLTGVALLPIAVLDYVAISWCIKLSEKIAKRRLPQQSA
jgi:ABC-type multidrug transport system permease subunit